MNQRLNQIKNLVNELKITLNINSENVHIEINENQDIITISAKIKEGEEREILVTIPK